MTAEASPPLPRTDQTIFDALSRAANSGLPCPRNDDLIALVNASSVSCTSAALSRLERRGLIRIERFRQGREVTIAATGKRTAAWNGNRKPHWRHDPRAGRNPVETPTARSTKLERQSDQPDRPCFRCGSRGWCGHDGRIAS